MAAHTDQGDPMPAESILMRLIVTLMFIVLTASSVHAQTPEKLMLQFADILQPDDSTKSCHDTGIDWTGTPTFTCTRSGAVVDTLILSTVPDTEYRFLTYFVNGISQAEAKALRDKLEAWGKKQQAKITECTARPNSNQSGVGTYFSTKEFAAFYTRRNSRDGSVRGVAGFQIPYRPEYDGPCPTSGILRGGGGA